MAHCGWDVLWGVRVGTAAFEEIKVSIGLSFTRLLSADSPRVSAPFTPPEIYLLPSGQGIWLPEASPSSSTLAPRLRQKRHSSRQALARPWLVEFEPCAHPWTNHCSREAWVRVRARGVGGSTAPFCGTSWTRPCDVRQSWSPQRKGCENTNNVRPPRVFVFYVY